MKKEFNLDKKQKEWDKIPPNSVPGTKLEVKKEFNIKKEVTCNTCNYPGCKKEGVYKQTFDVNNRDDQIVELPFCVYHHLIVVGGHFQTKVNIIPEIKPTKKEPKGTPKRKEFELIGPLKEVEIVEQVMGAIEFTKKLKNDNKGLSKK